MSGRASPIATTAACRLSSGPRKSPKSPPLKRPPRITTSPASKLSNRAQRRIDVGGLGIVDEADAVDLGDGLQRVLEPREALDSAASSRSGAIASQRRDGGGREHVCKQMSAQQLHRRRAARAARRRPASAGRSHCRRSARPRRARSRIANISRRLRASAGDRDATPRRRALTTAQSLAVLVREDAGLGRRVLRRVGMPIEMIGRKVQQHGDPRMEGVGRSRAESCWPRRRGSCRRSRHRPARSARTPMLPPTSTRCPPASSIRPVSVVVVDLPFVPVIATTRPRSQRDASSSSPITGTPGRARALDRRLSRRHAGAQHDEIGAGEGLGTCRPVRADACARAARSSSANRLGARRSG